MRFGSFSEPDDDARPVLGVFRSAGGRFWRDRLDAAGAAAASAMRQRHGLDDMLARVLAGRGVGIDEAPGFLDPTLRDLMSDPSVVTDMDRAVSRIADAVEANAMIAIFGDYDVDGASSTALFARYLGLLGRDCLTHIPDRLTEGYGPNPQAVRDLQRRGAGLLLTLDCGSTGFEALEAAETIGLDTIVVDHHQCGAQLPPAYALVNPNRQDDLSGLGHLAAVGVTFMVIVALTRELRRRGTFATRTEPDLLGLLDLVALGTIADVVPLVGLNRAFVVKGLVALRRRTNVGLAALTAVARLNGPVTPYHLGFLIGPRINAGGRIGDAGLGARLLITDDAAEAEALAAELDRLNRERQTLEALAVEAADAQVALEVGPGGEPGPLVIAQSDDWHPGIVGLIASRLKERWRRPAFALSFDQGEIGAGSGRSIAGVDLGAAVRAAVDAGILAKGGGHAMAAGLSVARDRVDDLKAFLAERLASTVAVAAAERSLLIDGVMTAGGAGVEFVGGLDRAGPYGAGHAEPLFAFPAHRIAFADPVGQGHVRLSLSSGDGTTLKAIAFRAVGEPLGDLLLASRGRPLHLAGSLSLDHWQGEPKVQLRVVDAADPNLGIG
ncbi:MAG: single-stranded-DNA-specific exonuclease RecJ [Ancalomicrobiaceae bacterium]|nr:single-stranded-DNA-specific exonuclease RecJ [Ancalomicrobiaceae bacterium]